MTKAEHLARILQRIADADEVHTGALAAEVAGLYALVDAAAELFTPAEPETEAIAGLVAESRARPSADAVWALVNRAQAAELSAEAATRECTRLLARAEAAELLAEDRQEALERCASKLAEAVRRAEQAERSSDELAARLIRIHSAVTEPGAIEKIVIILAEPDPREPSK